MKVSYFMPQFAWAGLVVLVAAAPPGYTGEAKSSTTTPSSVLSACTASGTASASGVAPCTVTAAPYNSPNGTLAQELAALLRGTAIGTASLTTLETSTGTSSSATPSPTADWQDDFGTLHADQFSVQILSGTKQVQIQTAYSNWGIGSKAVYYPLQCPNSGNDYESVVDDTSSALPWFLLFHGGNICQGSILHTWDNVWLKYSNLGVLNVQSDSHCAQEGEIYRCVLPLDPTKS